MSRRGGSEQYPVFDVNNDRFGWPNLTVTGISDIRGVVDGGNYNGNTYGNTGSTFKNCNVRGSFSVTSGHPILPESLALPLIRNVEHYKKLYVTKVIDLCGG